MEKIKIHKFIEMSVPTLGCNMRCNYCYVTQNQWWDSAKPDFSSFIDKVKEAFSAERLGGACMINMCSAGETLMHEEVVTILRQLLENGHYIMLVTNGTLNKRFERCCEFPEELRKRLFFKISFHYLELKRLNKLEDFIANIHRLKAAGISYTIELTPDDSYIPYIDEIKQVCMENFGALCHITVPRDERKKGYPLMTSMTREEFIKTWKPFESTLFEFKESIFEVKRKEFCYAGKWGFVVNLASGDYTQCYSGKKLGNIYDLSKKIVELPVGCNCLEGHCFNGHAFLGFGLIPELETPTFADMRNRVEEDGSQWLSSEVQGAMSAKLIDDNEEVKGVDRMLYNIRSINLKNRVKKLLKKR